MTSYTNIFGGFNVNTAFPSYNSFTFDTDITLNWASSFVDFPPGSNNVTAQINDLNPTAAALTVTLADATKISVGQTIQFNNVGGNTVIILDNQGGTIISIPTFGSAPQNQIILYLTDNTTAAGTWGVTQLGTGNSTIVPSTIAGLGTIPIGTTLNTNFPSKYLAGNYDVQLSDRASILVWIGGTGTITTPDSSTVPSAPDGFYFAVNNQGSGTVTINTPDGGTIDGLTSITLTTGQSSYIISTDPLNAPPLWSTLGKGVPNIVLSSVLIKNLSATASPYTLTNVEAQHNIINFTGLLTSNFLVYFTGNGPWYIFNNTTGAFTLTVQLFGPLGTQIVIPQSERVIIYSDGSTLYFTPTISVNASFPDGSVGAPSIHFSSDPTSGLYKVSNGNMGYSSSGVETLQFSDYGLGILAGGETRYYNAGDTNYVGFKAGVLAGNTIWTLPLADATQPGQILYSNAAAALAFTTAQYPVTTTINQLLYSSAANVISGLATANNGTLITSAGGVPSISSTLPLAVQLNITELGTITTGTWHGSIIDVAHGGTGAAGFAAFSVICGGTTTTNPLSNVGPGTPNQILVANGTAAYPTFQNINNVLPAATQAQQVAGAINTVYTNPQVQQYHKSACKAWVNFDGTTAGVDPAPMTIRDSYNVTSVIRTDTGTYTINFTNAFANTGYCGVANAGTTVANNVRGVRLPFNDTNTTVNSIDLSTYLIGGGGNSNSQFVSAQFFGTLA